jgi:hypothetical protein
MELPTALGYFSSNERRYEQGRDALFLALCFDQHRGCEPVHGFDFGAEAMLTTFNQQIDYGVGSTVLASGRRVDLGVDSSGLLERLPSGM